MKHDQAHDPVSHQNQQPRTDWFAWSIQLLFGLLAGSGVGFLIGQLLFRSRFVDFDQILFVVGGVSLCLGAFSSFYGNRAWTAAAAFDPSEPPKSRKARSCSMIVGTVGTGLILLPLILHLITAGLPANQSPLLGFTIFLLVLAVLPGFALVQALRTGNGLWRMGAIQREETPLIFWPYVVSNAFVVVCILFAVL